MNLENLKYLPEIVQFMETADHYVYQIKAPQFKSDIEIEEWSYPNDVENWDDKAVLLKDAECKTLMEPVNTLMTNAGFDLYTENDIKNGKNYRFVELSFAIKPLQKNGIFAVEAPHFYLIPYVDNDEKLQVKILLSKFVFHYNLFSNLKNAVLINLETKDELELQYLQKLAEATEIICNQFKISTEKNQGKFTEAENEDPEKLIEEFIEATKAKDFNDENEVLEFKNNWKLIRENPEEYKEILVDEGYFDEDEEVDIRYFTQHLISEFFCAYDTDWKMDHEELSEFISEEIGQDFKIIYEETLQKPEVIARKIEQESDFTLLNINTQMDSYSFFLCKKTEKDKILDFARQLEFPIEDF